MPREAVSLGAAEQVLPLSAIPAGLLARPALRGTTISPRALAQLGAARK